MTKEFHIREVGNGWMFQINDGTEWYYPSLDLCIAQLQPYLGKAVRVEHDPGKVRRGSSQIDLEEYIKEKE